MLDGVYKSPTARSPGPWNRIADSGKLQASGSALSGGAGVNYRPGMQAWYNNFIPAEPGNPDHVWLGLEEVYETKDGGSDWTTPGPYWNFGFKCWAITDAENTCPQTTHPDQHSIVTVRRPGLRRQRRWREVPADQRHSSKPQRPRHRLGRTTRQGLRTLQYYSVGVGADPERGGYAVAGGLQDNGGSLLRGDRKDNQGNTEMVSPFGGDGGDIIVDPRNGCHILDEYVYLELWMTTNCGQTDGSQSAIIDVGVPDANPRFTAPFRIVRGSENTGDHASERWVAGGNAVWSHDLGFSTTRGAGRGTARPRLDQARQPRHRRADGRRARCLRRPVGEAGRDQGRRRAAWCGESTATATGFTRGVQTNFGGSWHELDMTGPAQPLPERGLHRHVGADTATVYLVFNGYNRRFIEGPGAAQDHVWKGVLTRPAA